MPKVPTFSAPPEQVTEEDADAFMETATDIALVALQGLLASGHYKDNPRAAAHDAWKLVTIEFLKEQALFPSHIQTFYPAAEQPQRTAAE